MNAITRLVLEGCTVELEPRYRKGLPILVERIAVHIWDPYNSTDLTFECVPDSLEARLEEYANDRV